MTSCEICGVQHEELPDISSDAPFHWSDCLAKDSDSQLTSDLCVIEGRDHFIRGVIHIPVHEDERGFGWGVWVSLKKEKYEEYREQYNTADIGPFFGWLSTEIDFFSISTISLKTTVCFRGEGLRPRILVQACDHPLYLQQQEGLSLSAAWDIVHFYITKNNMTEQTGPANPRPFGTSVMPPADPASRAGATPEASGDS